MKILHAVLFPLAAAAVALLSLSCSSFPFVEPNDNGQHSFARQAVPMVFGRKAKGYDEVKFLADLTAASNRHVVLAAMMNDPEYVDQWSEVMVDILRVTRDRTDPKGQGQCFAPPLRPGPDGGTLATWVRDHAPDAGAAPGGPFNMSDLLRSSIELDDLSPVFRAWLFAMTSRPLGGNEIMEANKRDDLAVAFQRTYLHRQMLCLGCHNSDWSITDAGSGWNRTHPVPGSFETALWGPGFGGFDVPRMAGLFRTDILEGGVQPWGLTGCGSFLRSVGEDSELKGAGKTAFFIKDLGLRSSVWDLEAALADGVRSLAPRGLSRTGVDANGDGFADTLIGNQAFAYMTGVAFVNQVWSEVYGGPLTIPIYFPRNKPQRDALMFLTDADFLGDSWSLRELLRTSLGVKTFNRVTPRLHTPARSPYDIPMFFDPWVEADPRTMPPPDPPLHNNAMSEAVHRHSPRTLFQSVHRALDWPAPARFPGKAFPDVDLLKASGLFFKDAEPGLRGSNFEALLHWESQLGAGNKPQAADDWIDRLLRERAVFDGLHPANPSTVGDVVQTVKDWLLGDGTIRTAPLPGETEAESALLSRHFGVADLTKRFSSVADAQTKVRQYVGVLLESPQFQLAGIAAPELGPRPRLRVCNAGPCSYREICTAFQPKMAREGYALTCRDNSVVVIPERDVPPVRDFCTPGKCKVVRPRIPVKLESLTALPQGAPPCDPRCSGVECCGGPELATGDRPEAMIAWAEGGRVDDAANVRYRAMGTVPFIPLAVGTTLAAGDVLLLENGNRLTINAPDGVLHTPGLPPRADGQPWVLVITGPGAMRLPPVQRGDPIVMTPARLKELMLSEAVRHGEAGPPLEDPSKMDRSVPRVPVPPRP